MLAQQVIMNCSKVANYYSQQDFHLFKQWLNLSEVSDDCRKRRICIHRFEQRLKELDYHYKAVKIFYF